jgi:hypothetical protein
MACWRDVPAVAYPVIMDALLDGRDGFSLMASSKEVYSCRKEMQGSLQWWSCTRACKTRLLPTRKFVVHFSIYTEVRLRSARVGFANFSASLATLPPTCHRNCKHVHSHRNSCHIKRFHTAAHAPLEY